MLLYTVKNKLEPKVLGVSVHPSVFGGSLAQLPALFGNSCVDFMGAGDATARQDTFGGALPPMYPFNAMLTTNRNSLNQFASTSAPLGFIHFPAPRTGLSGDDVSLCASLTAQLNMSFLTTDILTGVNPFGAPRGGPLQFAMGPLTFPMTNAAFAQKTLISHAIDLLRQCTSASLTEIDRAITLDDVRFARFVGRYLLINIINAET